MQASPWLGSALPGQQGPGRRDVQVRQVREGLAHAVEKSTARKTSIFIQGPDMGVCW